MPARLRPHGWKRRVAQAAVALAAVGATVPLAAAPAHADSTTCGALAGSYANGNVIGLCLKDWWVNYPGGTLPSLNINSEVLIGPRATSATACKVTGWAELDKTGSNIWTSTKVTRDCNAALEFRNSWSTYGHGVGHTSSTDLNVHGCIDLYFNNSTHSGWQRCMDTGWHSKNAND